MLHDGLRYNSTKTRTRLPLRLLIVISICRRIFQAWIVSLHDEVEMLALLSEKKLASIGGNMSDTI